MLVRDTTRYLVGDTDPVRLNFLSGKAIPVVALPLAPRFSSYSLWRGGDRIESVAADGQNELRFPQAVAPGNYAVEGEGQREGEARRAGLFSVNLPPEECLLTRVPVRNVEALFGAGSVAALDV